MRQVAPHAAVIAAWKHSSSSPCASGNKTLSEEQSSSSSTTSDAFGSTTSSPQPIGSRVPGYRTIGTGPAWLPPSPLPTGPSLNTGASSFMQSLTDATDATPYLTGPMGAPSATATPALGTMAGMSSPEDLSSSTPSRTSETSSLSLLPPLSSAATNALASADRVASGNRELSDAGIAGTVVGTLVAVSLCSLAALLACKRRRRAEA